MNVLAIVLSLLLIFACTYSLSMRKIFLAKPVELTYRANAIANRQLRNQYESHCYARLPRVKKGGDASPSKEKKQAEPRPHKPNGVCARLNLWPLLEDGAKEHPALYQLAAKLLRTFYGEALFEGQKRLEFTVLDALLEAGRRAKKGPGVERIALEKLSIQGHAVKRLYSLQTLYYLMLKGTKKGGYPSLLDYFAMDSKESLVCVQHGSCELLMALFGPESGARLFEELADPKNTGPEHVRIEEELLAGRLGDVGAVVTFQPSCNGSKERTLVQEAGDVLIKKRVYF